MFMTMFWPMTARPMSPMSALAVLSGIFSRDLRGGGYLTNRLSESGFPPPTKPRKPRSGPGAGSYLGTAGHGGQAATPGEDANVDHDDHGVGRDHGRAVRPGSQHRELGG